MTTTAPALDADLVAALKRLKLAKVRDRQLADAVLAALEAGRKYIDSAAGILETARPR